jgi:hypothetical protein
MNVDDLKGKTWKHILGVCGKPVLLAVSQEDEMVEAAKLIEDCGPKAGACYIVAVLMARHNPMMAINAATHHYKRLAKTHGIDELRDAVHEMETWTAWGGFPFTSPCPTKKWPVEPPEEMLTSQGGLLNFLLLEGSKRLNEKTPTESLVLMGVRDFFKWLNDKGGLKNLARRPAMVEHR